MSCAVMFDVSLIALSQVGAQAKGNPDVVLDIGTSNGYSSLWIAKGLRATGGKLIPNIVQMGRDGFAVSCKRRVEKRKPGAK